MPMAEPAIPPKPNTAATSAMIKNITAQFNIEHSFLRKTIAVIFVLYEGILVIKQNESIVPRYNKVATDMPWDNLISGFLLVK
jgi:hypothetical protein